MKNMCSYINVRHKADRVTSVDILTLKRGVNADMTADSVERKRKTY